LVRRKASAFCSAFWSLEQPSLSHSRACVLGAWITVCRQVEIFTNVVAPKIDFWHEVKLEA